MNKTHLALVFKQVQRFQSFGAVCASEITTLSRRFLADRPRIALEARFVISPATWPLLQPLSSAQPETPEDQHRGHTFGTLGGIHARFAARTLWCTGLYACRLERR